MNNYNWLTDMHKDVWTVILHYCDPGCVNMLYRVSHCVGEIIGSCPNVNLCDYGVLYGSIDLIMWAMTNGFRCTTVTSDLAIAHGNLEMVQWLYSINCPLSEFACDIAANNGHLNIYKWLPKDKTVKRSTWESAIRGGNLELIIFISNGHRVVLHPSSIPSCTIAAERGYLDILQWLYKTGVFRCYLSTSQAAASNGHLEILKWLRENECPWDDSVYVAAVHGGHLEVSQWLRKNGCPTNAGHLRRRQI